MQTRQGISISHPCYEEECLEWYEHLAIVKFALVLGSLCRKSRMLFIISGSVTLSVTLNHTQQKLRSPLCKPLSHFVALFSQSLYQILLFIDAPLQWRNCLKWQTTERTIPLCEMQVNTSHKLSSIRPGLFGLNLSYFHLAHWYWITHGLAFVLLNLSEDYSRHEAWCPITIFKANLRWWDSYTFVL